MTINDCYDKQHLTKNMANNIMSSFLFVAKVFFRSNIDANLANTHNNTPIYYLSEKKICN